MSNVLVTGGAGFIGSFLCEQLLELNNSITILDNLSTGNKENVSPLLKEEAIDFHVGSILDELLLESLIKKADTIYHMAAAVGVKYVVENPILSISTNTRGTENILRLCASYGKRVFIASSSEVYGRSRDLPFREDGELVFGPTQVSRWSYACSKVLDEFMSMAYHKEDGLDVCVGRLFNICGPRQTGAYGMVIPRFIQQALSGEPITVYGDGTQKRSFTSVKDAVSYVIALTDQKETAGEIYNIGSSNNISIYELAQNIKELTQSSSEIVLIPYEDTYEKGFEDIEDRIPDTTKLQTACPGITPLSLEEILQQTIEYHSENL